MNQKPVFLFLVVFILGLAVALLFPKADPPPAELEKLPEPYYTVLWENDDVRIVEHRIPVNDEEPKHSHPAMAAYSMSDCTVEITEADGTVHEESLSKGQFLEVPPWTHSIKNIGDSPLHTLLVELKP